MKLRKEIKKGKKPAPELPFCGCKCGGRVTKPGNKYIQGHNSRVDNPFKDKEHTDETKKLISKSRKGKYVGEDHHLYGKHPSDETREKQSKARKGKYVGEKHPFFGKHHSEETKELISSSRKGKCCGKDHPMHGKHHTEESKQKSRESNLGKKRSEETKQKMSDAHKGRKLSEEHKKALNRHNIENNSMKDPEIRAKVSGKNHWCYGKRGKEAPNWRGGISKEPYCSLFDEEFKERVREFFNRCCYVCGKSEKENGRKLDVHHVNYDKMVCCNDVKPLFVPLCHSCHGKTHGDREYWEEFFTVSLEYLTDGECFIKKDERTKKNVHRY